jgi:hypothetical protein
MCRYYKQFIVETMSNCNHFGLINAYFTKSFYLIYLWNGHYNTFFHVIIINMCYWITI